MIVRSVRDVRSPRSTAQRWLNYPAARLVLHSRILDLPLRAELDERPERGQALLVVATEGSIDAVG